MKKETFTSKTLSIAEKEMNDFETRVSTIFESILANEKEINKLIELKQLVISRIGRV